MIKAPSEAITPRYLNELHPELTRYEAHLLYVFCWDNGIRHVDCYGSGSIMYKLWKESKLKNMNKKIEMSLETARQMYKEGNETTNKWLLENFTKEELEPKKGFTWGESFNGEGSYIHGMAKVIKTLGLTPSDENRNVFLTEKHAKSALAFAQLSHICEKYNEGKYYQSVCGMTNYWYVTKFDGKSLGVNSFPYHFLHLAFTNYEDAITSMEVNRQLWLDYWMID